MNEKSKKSKEACLSLVGKKVVDVRQSNLSSFSVHFIFDDGSDLHIPTDESGFQINDEKDIGAPTFSLDSKIFLER